LRAAAEPQLASRTDPATLDWLEHRQAAHGGGPVFLEPEQRQLLGAG